MDEDEGDIYFEYRENFLFSFFPGQKTNFFGNLYACLLERGSMHIGVST